MRMPSSVTSVSTNSGKLGLAPVSHTLNTGDLVLRGQHPYLMQHCIESILSMLSILTSDYDKGGLRMIDIEKFIWSLKISWVKRILQTESNSLLKHLYENVFKQFGGNILFECNFREADIIKHFNKKPFFRDLYGMANQIKLSGKYTQQKS